MKRARWPQSVAAFRAVLWLSALAGGFQHLQAAESNRELAAATQAYREGNYRSAATALNTVGRSIDQSPVSEQLAFWDLSSKVAEESGMPALAESAAEHYVKLLKQSVTPAAGVEQAVVLRHSLARLALLKRNATGVASGAVASDPEVSAALQQSVVLLREAIDASQSTKPDLLWLAETRLELARTLEWIKQTEQARSELEASKEAARAAIKELLPKNNTIEQFLRMITVIRYSYAAGDSAAAKQQAEEALHLLQERAASASVVPQDRGTLQIEIAACQRQHGDRGEEKRVLESVLREDDLFLKPLVRAGALVRLAELCDADDSLSPETARSLAQENYRDAAKIYAAQFEELQERTSERSKPTTTAASPTNRPDAPRSLGEELACLSQLQFIHTRLEEWNEAIAAAQAQLDERRKLLLLDRDPLYFRTLSSLGSLHARRARSLHVATVADGGGVVLARADIEKGQQYLDEAAKFWRKLQPSSPVDLATTLNYYAEVLRYGGDYQQADAILNELMQLVDAHRESLFANDELLLVEFYTNRAAVQAAIGHFALALPYYERAIEIGKASDDPDTLRQRRRLLAMVYLNIAQLHKSQRHLGEARKACEEAFAAAQQAGLSDAERVPFELAKSSLLISEAEQDHARLGAPKVLYSNAPADAAPEQIRIKFTEAISITRQLRALPSTPSDGAATASYLQALAQYRLVQIGGAGEVELQDAERLWKQIVESNQDDVPQLALLRLRASIYLTEIALSDVAKLRQQAHALSETDSTNAQIEVLRSHSSERMKEAIEQSRRGEEAAGRMIAYPAVRVQSMLARAHVLRAEAQISQAKVEALQSQLVDDPKLADAIEREKLAAASSTDEAIAKLQQALEFIELPRAMTVGAEQERAEYFAQFAPVFDLLVDLLVENNRFQEAIAVAERRRSRTFQDQLRASGTDLYATAPAELVATTELARDAYYKKLAQLVEEWADPNQRKQLSDELETLRDAFVKADREAKSASVAGRQLLIGRPNALEMSELTHSLGEDVAAIIYYTGAERSYVFAYGGQGDIICRPLMVTRAQAEARGLPLLTSEKAESGRPLRASDVVRLVTDLRHSHDKNPLHSSRGSESAAEPNAGLKLTYTAVVSQATEHIATDILLPADVRDYIAAAKAKHLVIIPDGALHELPFEMLRVDDPASRTRRYLINVLPPLCYAPSLYIYRMLRLEPESAAWEVALLSVADPQYPQVVQSDLEATRDISSAGREFLLYKQLPKLSFAKEESDAVCSAFKNSNQSPGSIVHLMGKDASETGLKQALRRAKGDTARVGFLHVAAHGLVSQQYSNLFGAIALTQPDSITADDDGFLRVHEIYSLPITGCELAVLSACETNCGPDSPLEAGSTMARAFLCAGAKRVVSSHWSVDDRATNVLVSQLMRDISRELAADQRIDYAKALQSAKQRLQADENAETASPYFWAPFVLIGPPTSNGSASGTPVAVRGE